MKTGSCPRKHLRATPLWHVSRILPSAMSWKKQLPRSMKTKRPPPLLRSHGSKRSRPFIRFDDGDGHGAAHLPRRKYSEKNPYYEQIHISPDKENRIALATADYLPYEFFQTFPVTKENPFLYGEAGFFKERMTFPVILENNRVWMSVVPSEIRSMEKDIEAAKEK